jgi:tetratricopeptide (TPR) repeat protein
MKNTGQSKKTLWHSTAVHIIIIAAVSVIAYLNSLGNGFVGDDNGFVAYNVSIRDLGNLPDFFFDSAKTLAGYDQNWGTYIYRPLRTASYAFDYAVFGQWAPGFHITNLVLHLLTIVTVYLFARALLGIPSVSFLAGLIFALHPTHIETVSWISSRADMIALIFANLSLLAYMRFKKGGRSPYLLLALLLAFVSYLGKETMVSFPGLIVLYDYAAREKKGFREFIGSNILSWILFTAVTLAYLVFRFQMTGRMSTVQGWWGGTPYTNFLMMLKATAVYLKLLVFPFDLNLHYIISETRTFLDAKVMASAALILSTFGLAAYLHGKSRVSFFLVVWFYIGLVPIANIIPNSFSMLAERYLYMPSQGPIIAISLGAYAFYGKLKSRSPALSKAAAVAFTAIMAAYFVTIIGRNGVYKDDFSFYSAAVKDSPESAPSHKCLADQYLGRKDQVNALAHYDKALAIDPNYAEAMVKKAEIHAGEGSFDKAISLGERAVSIKPTDAVLRFTLGTFYKNSGQMQLALDQWQKAVELYPYYAEAYNNLGAYYQTVMDNENALRMYEKSIGVNPFNAEAFYNMAVILEGQGEWEKARSGYARFTELAGPEYADVVAEVKNKLR